jgi:Zn-dependent protease
MLGQAGPTAYDLQFRCFGIPVRVTPWFWLAGVLLGRGYLEQGRPELLLIWVLCLFVSILVHEMGHALVANAFGWPPSIILYHFGGLAMFQPYRNYTPWRSIAVSFAGPGAGFLLYGLVLLIELILIWTRTWPGEAGLHALGSLEYINLWWGLVNLLPTLPLDGGRISQEVFHMVRPRDGFELAAKFGMLVAAIAAAYFFAHHENYGLYPGILFAYLCMANYEMLRHLQGQDWR